MSDVWYTSDIHVGHRLVAGIRGFNAVLDDEGKPSPDDVAEHDRVLGANWDAVVKPGDQVYVLGDISINGGQHALDWIAARPGTKHLIAGNHDPVHPMDRRATKKTPHWLGYFETVQPFMRRKLGGQDLLLSHFPYASWGDGEGREGSRYDQYRLPDLGAKLLHGHTHGTERGHGTMLHVGVDAWGLSPVPQQAVIDWMTTTNEATE